MCYKIDTPPPPNIKFSICIWAPPRENQTLLHTNNKGTDQSLHLYSVISAFIIHFLERRISKLAICKIVRLLLVSEGWFEHDLVRDPKNRLSHEEPRSPYHILSVLIIISVFLQIPVLLERLLLSDLLEMIADK